MDKNVFFQRNTFGSYVFLDFERRNVRIDSLDAEQYEQK